MKLYEVDQQLEDLILQLEPDPETGEIPANEDEIIAQIVSTIVQPVPEIAEACVNTVLSKHLSAMPSLICLPVHYAAGGTTKE